MATVEALDVEAARARFAALERPVSFLDGPGGSQVPREVVEAIGGYLVERNANLGGAFAASRESDEVMEAGRRAAADFVGAAPEEIAFGANMTTLNFNLTHSFARTLRPGDEIVTTVLDHDANVSPWLLVAKDHGLVVRRVDIDRDDCTLDYGQLESLLSERTKVVAFTLASNGVGTIPDAGRISELAHGVGALAWGTGCTTRRTAGSTSARSGWTCCCARRTSSSARTWAWPTAAATCSRAGPPTGSGRRTRSRPGTATRPAPRTTRSKK